MKRNSVVIALAIIAMLLTGCGVGGSVEPENFSLSGKIVDNNGNGIPNVTVGFSGSFGIATTDNEGLWSKDGLRGIVTISPVKDGWIFESRKVSKLDQNVDFVGVKRVYPLSVLITGKGTVDEEVILSAQGQEYEHGVRVRLTAVPETGWRFSHWEGDLDGSINPSILVVDAKKSVTAVFVRLEYIFNVAIEGKGTVEETSLVTQSKKYQHGAQIRLTAVPETGWRFSHWEGDLEGSENPATILIDNDKDVTAVFAKRELLKLDTSYVAPDGLTVILHDFTVIERDASYQYNILYTLKNDSDNQKILEGTFKLFYANELGGVPQYGFFDYLFPGDSITRAYVFEELKSDTFAILQYRHDHFGHSRPSDDALHWSVQY